MEKRRLFLNLTKNKRITLVFEKCFSDATATNNNERTTHFGYKTVKESDKVKEGTFYNLCSYLNNFAFCSFIYIIPIGNKTFYSQRKHTLYYRNIYNFVYEKQHYI